MDNQSSKTEGNYSKIAQAPLPSSDLIVNSPARRLFPGFQNMRLERWAYSIEQDLNCGCANSGKREIL